MEFIKKGKVEFIFEKNSELPLCVKFKNIYFTITGNLAITNQDVIKAINSNIKNNKYKVVQNMVFSVFEIVNSSNFVIAYTYEYDDKIFYLDRYKQPLDEKMTNFLKKRLSSNILKKQLYIRWKNDV